jgi:hypothetical protein
MPLLILFAMIVLFGIAMMLKDLNPAPVVFQVSLLGHHALVTASLLEVIGYSAGIGAVVVGVQMLGGHFRLYRDRRRAERDAEALRRDNAALRHDAENARSDARLLELRLAEAEERYAALEAEVRPLLTMRRDDKEPPAPASTYVPHKPKPSRWRRR